MGVMNVQAMLQVRAEGEKATAVICGSIYFDEARMVKGELLEHVEKKGIYSWEIDVSQVDYMASEGVGMLLALQKRVREKGGGVVILGAAGVVGELLRLSKLDRIFEFR